MLTDAVDARPDFAIIVYPSGLAAEPDMTTLNPIFTPNASTPPTFLLQAENDKSYGKNAPIYYQALAAAGISAELHMYATGGHGFGVRPEGKPEQYWTRLATFWLRGMEMIPAMVNRPADNSAPLATPALPPCPPPDLTQPSATPANQTPQ